MKSWKDISVKTLQEVIKLSELTFDDDIDRQVKILSLVSGKSEDYILDLTKQEVKELQAEYKFLDMLPESKEVKGFKCGGYFWIPQTNISKLKQGQYIDISHFTKDADKLIDNIPSLLAIYCIPYKKYSFIKVKAELDFTEKRDILYSASIADVYPLSVFFCHLIIILMQDSKPFLEEQVKKIMKMEKQKQTVSMSNGDGI